MHLLATQAGRIEDGKGAVDLNQSPADIVFLSAADTELSCMAVAHARMDAPKPTLRLANLTELQHPYSVDLYLEKTLSQSKIILVRLLGGMAYWRYGIEQIAALAKDNSKKIILLPGDDREDHELRRLSKCSGYDCVWRYFCEGGITNAWNCLKFLSDQIGFPSEADRAEILPRYGLYWPGHATSDDLPWHEKKPIVPILFYRALLQSGTMDAVDRLIEALTKRGMNALPLYVQSLKDAKAQGYLKRIFSDHPPSVTLNCLSFAVNEHLFGDSPVLQIFFSSEDEESWRKNVRGLSPRDLAMQVALPEVDGKISSRAISFKVPARYDEVTQCRLVRPKPNLERIAFVADMAASWVKLRETKRAERSLGIILANYPNRDGRIGNGVGLDVPQSLLTILNELKKASYDVAKIPASTLELMELLSSDVTNARHARISDIVLDEAAYQLSFKRLPLELQTAVKAQWGDLKQDPFFRNGAFHLAMKKIGKMFIGIQPARGYQIDPVKTYHDPELVPPHYYLAFYFYLQKNCHAMIHLGKHGTLEWLPGKALALSSGCWPEILMGPVPHFYPFIVNDPGEGTQAKRRSSAVIVDHMTPPLTRAESYGDLSELERLVDEYYEAAQLDPRRLRDVAQRILQSACSLGLDKDCGIIEGDGPDKALVKLDNHLCELKELQIRDGLHIFGREPQQMDELLAALVRAGREQGKGKDQSLLRALAKDLALGFDPLHVDPTLPWLGARPDALNVDGQKASWRSHGDTVERLEELALDLIKGEREPDPDWQNAAVVLDFIQRELRPLLRESAIKEIHSLLLGLDGKFVVPGPSGAPTRGRLDVLPTGRNFYSVDTRAVPTQSAWALGWKSAVQLLEHHKNLHGAWPRSLVLSVWGTSNMRTGGDDIAQALAFLGVRPLWEEGGRVNGYEILPLSILDRPRVDVTLRISGFFRDAFPSQIDLFDSAVRAVGALEEPFALNPIAENMQKQRAHLREVGIPERLVELRAGHRIFGAKPGAYGTGLQAMLDEGLWSSHHDLGQMFIEWGSYAYGGGVEGSHEPDQFSDLLSNVDAVLHNQDNREHDILDSDDYYQFEGGLTAAIRHLTDRIPAIWHSDHSQIDAPKSRSLDQELGRIVRGRAANPKWIKGVMRHGYKGASEMAATVDYLFAFAATTGLVSDHHFLALYQAYLGNADVRAFIATHNPAALREMATRLLDAIQRGLWQVKFNSIPEQLESWAK